MDEQKYKDFGVRLKELLKANNMTQTDLSKATGLSQSSICRYCYGDRIPDAVKAVKIAELLGTSTEYLIRGETEDKEAVLATVETLLKRNAGFMTNDEKFSVIELLFASGRNHSENADIQ